MIYYYYLILTTQFSQKIRYGHVDWMAVGVLMVFKQGIQQKLRLITSTSNIELENNDQFVFARLFRESNFSK